ncbi:MAG: GNAT family N-acetyltransferase [Bacteroidales bacterium]|nr:GNAT family N-acetyltransferase [Bacteroidales bacterium]
MALAIQVVHAPGLLDVNWDKLATCYFQKTGFLHHLHLYNPCNQRYYELFEGDRIIAGAVVYSLKVNLFTFSGLQANVKMQVIGLPVSVAAPSLIGDHDGSVYLINEILAREKGVILGLNLPVDLKLKKVVPMMTLPTIIFRNRFPDFTGYIQALRHPYRRRIRLILEKSAGVSYVMTKCREFTELHYKLYLEIMKRTTTRLETLSFDLFRNLPDNFVLGSQYDHDRLIAWHTLCFDGGTMFFFFGGMDYTQRDKLNSYNNNLLHILQTGIEKKCSMIDFGQTAEIAKMRLGAEVEPRAMFLYLHNPPALFLVKLFKSLMTYSKKQVPANVFKV